MRRRTPIWAGLVLLVGVGIGSANERGGLEKLFQHLAAGRPVFRLDAECERTSFRRKGKARFDLRECRGYRQHVVFDLIAGTLEWREDPDDCPRKPSAIGIGGIGCCTSNRFLVAEADDDSILLRDPNAKGYTPRLYYSKQVCQAALKTDMMANAAGGDSPPADKAGTKEDEEGASASKSSSPTAFVPLDKEIIRNVIRYHLGEVRTCFEQALIRRPTLAGRVTVRFTISPEGTVTSATVEKTTLGDANVEKCITSCVATWVFPKPLRGRFVLVSYPFILKPAGDNTGSIDKASAVIIADAEHDDLVRQNSARTHAVPLGDSFQLDVSKLPLPSGATAPKVIFVRVCTGSPFRA